MRGSEKRRMEAAINRHVGARLRAFRLYRGWSQKELASGLHISYQQIQKYEIARNRISAGMLWRLAQVLGVRVETFYGGIEGDGEGLPDIPSPSSETLRVAFALGNIRSAGLKIVIAEILALAGVTGRGVSGKTRRTGGE